VAVFALLQDGLPSHLDLAKDGLPSRSLKGEGWSERRDFPPAGGPASGGEPLKLFSRVNERINI